MGKFRRSPYQSVHHHANVLDVTQSEPLQYSTICSVNTIMAAWHRHTVIFYYYFLFVLLFCSVFKSELHFFFTPSVSHKNTDIDTSLQ